MPHRSQLYNSSLAFAADPWAADPWAAHKSVVAICHCDVWQVRHADDPFARMFSCPSFPVRSEANDHRSGLWGMTPNDLRGPFSRRFPRCADSSEHGGDHTDRKRRFISSRERMLRNTERELDRRLAAAAAERAAEAQGCSAAAMQRAIGVVGDCQPLAALPTSNDRLQLILRDLMRP